MHSWTILNHISVWGSFIVYFLFYLVFYSAFVLGITPQQSYYGVQYAVYGSGSFWLCVLLTPAIAILPVFAYRSLLLELNPTIFDRVRRIWISIVTTLLSADWLKYEHEITWSSPYIHSRCNSPWFYNNGMSTFSINTRQVLTFSENLYFHSFPMQSATIFYMYLSESNPPPTHDELDDIAKCKVGYIFMMVAESYWVFGIRFSAGYR